MILEKYFTKEEIDEIKNCSNMFHKCDMLVTRLFNDRVDKEGAPYIGHLHRVSNMLKNEDEKCAALLHDTLEDIDGMTKEILLSLNIPEHIIDMVLLVTKESGTSYDDEINKIIESKNDGALRLKYADMSDNSDPVRLQKLDEITRQRLSNKYQPQMKKLILELKKRGIYND